MVKWEENYWGFLQYVRNNCFTQTCSKAFPYVRSTSSSRRISRHYHSSVRTNLEGQKSSTSGSDRLISLIAGIVYHGKIHPVSYLIHLQKKVTKWMCIFTIHKWILRSAWLKICILWQQKQKTSVVSFNEHRCSTYLFESSHLTINADSSERSDKIQAIPKENFQN